jgi:hypothetical protein
MRPAPDAACIDHSNAPAALRFRQHAKTCRPASRSRPATLSAVERAADVFVGPAFARFALAGLEQNTRLQNDLCPGLTLRDQLTQPTALFAAELDNEFVSVKTTPG